jgi:hypothetical protein
MKRTLAILALMIGIALTSLFALAMAQSGSSQHDQSAQTDERAAASCPIDVEGHDGDDARQRFYALHDGR